MKKGLIKLTNKRIPLKDYQKLRSLVGLLPKSGKSAKIALKNTLHFVNILNSDDDFIGMARVIGDAGAFCQVVDICVHPDWQRRGIGSLIMADICNYIDDELPETCYISIMGFEESVSLYKKFGFYEISAEFKGVYIRK